MFNRTWRRAVLPVAWVGLLGCVGLSCDGSAGRSTAPVSRDLYDRFDDRFQEHLAAATREMGREVLIYESISPDLLPKKVTISGTHYELGYLLGLIASKHRGPWFRTRTSQNEAINQQIVEMYESVYPPYLDLVRGFAAVSNLTLDDVNLVYAEHGLFDDLWWELFQYEDFLEQTAFAAGPDRSNLNCSLVSYFLKNENRHLIGRNFDNPTDRPHFVVAADLQGAYRTVGNAVYVLYNRIADGANERGLFVGVASNASPPRYWRNEPDYPDEPAVHVGHLVRIVLETCATIEEALALIGSVRVWFPSEGIHLLIADGEGRAAVVEFDTDRRMVAFPRGEEPYVVLTNTAYQAGLDYVGNDCWRYRKGVQMLASGIRDSGEVLQVMKAMRQNTLWTSLFDLSTGRMEVRYRTEGYRVPHHF